MCGIAGVWGLGIELGAPDTAAVQAMVGALRHRGPDDRRVLSDPACVLGNARLAVLDVSPAAALPMSSADGRARLGYNGIVTNFRQLREGLSREARARFRTTSDSEVLLALYEDRGIGFVDDLRGAFAFCLHDRARRKAFLVRDCFGLRPVFYARIAGRLWFASEIKALLEVPGLDRTLDREALWHYFSLGYIPGDRTPFMAVRELLKGHLLEADLAGGGVETRRHHRLEYGNGPDLSEDETVAQVKERLLESLRRNLAADVPVGLTLSGGIDSSGLLAMAKHLGVSRSLHTFSIVMDESSFDESSHQKTMVEFARPIHHEVRVRARDVMENLEEAAAHLDEPLVNGAAVPMLLLAREARRHVKVLLSGEGGDEVFNAYETHRAYKARALYRRLVPGPVRGAVRKAAEALPCSYGKLSFDFLCKRFAAGAELDVPGAHFHWRHVLGEEEKDALFVRGKDDAWPPTPRLFSEFYESLAPAEPLDRLSKLDLRYYFVDDLMVKNDRMASANSLEVRFPYMEREVVEFAAGIPSGLRLRGFQGRYIQKRALAEFLPRPILRRANMGLEMPHSLWLLDELLPLADRYLSREAVEATGLLRYEAVEKLRRDHTERRRDNGRALWAILNFVVWHGLFVGRSDYKKHLVAAE